MSASEKPAFASADRYDKDLFGKPDATTPRRVVPRILAAPKIRQLYWCDFWQDSCIPEMWKTRPVVILSPKNSLYGICTIVACSTDPQEGDSARWAHALSTSLDSRKTFVVCNHIYTVSASRLSADRKGIPRLSEAEFHEILTKTLQWLPRLPKPDKGDGG
jgi:mRNA interferase MazF